MVFGWTLATLGMLFGLVLTLVPGVPGCAVVFLGVAGLHAASDGALPPPPALGLSAGITLVGCVAQGLAPVWGTRAVTTSTGAATGAMLGVALTAWAPLPLAALLGGGVGGVLGALVRADGWTQRVGGVLGGLAGGCGGLVLAVALDALAVLALAAVLGASAHGL